MEPCPDCGAPLGGREGCDRAFHTLGSKAAQDPRFAYGRRALVDAYCLQHPAYIASTKSLAAHLLGLCLWMEPSSDSRAQEGIWSRLSIPPSAAKPALPAAKPASTIAGVVEASTPRDHQQAVDALTRATWQQWKEHHELARAWLAYSIERAKAPKKHR